MLSNISYITHTNSQATQKRMKKSSSMKKLIEMSKQFQIDTQRNLERIGTKNEKSLYNDTNDSFYLTSMKTNELIRDSSFGNMRIKRTNSLKEMIMVTETKSKYLTRSNSRKILNPFPKNSFFDLQMKVRNQKSLCLY